MIAGLTRQVAHTLTVLEHGHSISVETPNDWTRRAGTKRSHGNTGLGLERRADGGFELLLKILAGEHGRGRIRLELRTRVGTHRHHLGKVQIEGDHQVERRACGVAATSVRAVPSARTDT